MGTIQLGDGFGLTGSVTPGKGITKYFKSLPQSMTFDKNIHDIASKDLTDPAVKSLEAGVTFDAPVAIGVPGMSLKVGASASAKLDIFVPGKDKAPLFDPDVYGDEIEVALTDRYVSLAMIGGFDATVGDSEAPFKFGFDGKTGVTSTYYQRFTQGTDTLTAIETTCGNYSIPGDVDDIAAMSEGDIATVDSTGGLKFNGSVNLLSVVNPLATADVPIAGKIGVTGGASINVAASYQYDGDYQVRVHRLAGNVFRLGFYRKKDSIFDFSVTANAGVTAKLGDNDLFVKFATAVSASPTDDMKTLEAEGVSDTQAKAIQIVLKSAINRTLAIGAGVELSHTDESDAMFLYEVDQDALTDDGRGLLNAALGGDLGGLVSADDGLPAGITVVKTVIGHAKTMQHGLKVNLLGIYNVQSLAKLVISGSSVWDGTTGELVLTDRVDEDRVDILTDNYAAKDTEKLRQVLSDHFLITASYRAVANVVDSASVNGVQAYFHLEQNPDKERMSDYLNLSALLGLQDSAAAQGELVDVGDYGTTTVYAEATYDDAAFRSMFFDGGGQLLDAETYASAGRAAIASMVSPGDEDDFRLQLATNDALFKQLEDIGNVQSGQFQAACVSAGVPSNMVPVVGTDYINVVWLRDSMQSAGKKLLAVDQYVAQNPNLDPTDPQFLNLKADLAKSLAGVVKNSTVEFGGPWGFAAMACLHKYSSSKWLITNQYVTKELSATGNI